MCGKRILIRQPVLVGTITIETSELISRMLKKEGILLLNIVIAVAAARLPAVIVGGISAI